MRTILSATTSLYSPEYPKTLVYMLQTNEYQTVPYLRWFWRTNNFRSIAKRKQLSLTRPARLLLFGVAAGMFTQIVLGLLILYLGIDGRLTGGIEFGLAILLSYPIIWAHLIIFPLVFGRFFISKPQEKKLVSSSRKHFKATKAVKIAVAGSYGKTTMKEILGTVIAEGKKVAITPANKNVASSHAKFAQKLKGDEEVLIIEYGEGAPGDVAKFNTTVQPDIGVITGLAPAHLDKYKTVKAAGEDIMTLADFLKYKKVYVNGESPQLEEFIKPSQIIYTNHGADGWKVSKVDVSQEGMRFVVQKGKQKLSLQTSLVGRHLLGGLVVAVAIAKDLGLNDEQIAAGISKTAPFEHRMQPTLLHGAWIFDDTYNGNIEGIKAGTALLKELNAKRKIYVTPGLVDQGAKSREVHIEMGRLIAHANPDKVVLMKHSVTPWIQAGLTATVFIQLNYTINVN